MIKVIEDIMSVQAAITRNLLTDWIFKKWWIKRSRKTEVDNIHILLGRCIKMEQMLDAYTEQIINAYYENNAKKLHTVNTVNLVVNSCNIVFPHP